MLVVGWLLTRFHWGVVFWGSFTLLPILVVAGGFVLRLLWERATGTGGESEPEP